MGFDLDFIGITMNYLILLGFDQDFTGITVHYNVFIRMFAANYLDSNRIRIGFCKNGR